MNSCVTLKEYVNCFTRLYCSCLFPRNYCSTQFFFKKSNNRIFAYFGLPLGFGLLKPWIEIQSESGLFPRIPGIPVQIWTTKILGETGPVSPGCFSRYDPGFQSLVKTSELARIHLANQFLFDLNFYYVHLAHS